MTDVFVLLKNSLSQSPCRKIREAGARCYACDRAASQPKPILVTVISI